MAGPNEPYFFDQAKATLVKAWRETLDNDLPQSDFQGTRVSVKFPTTADDFPGVLVDLQIVGNLTVAGIGHVEYSEPDLDTGTFDQPVRRWFFKCYADFTAYCLSETQRDRLFGELVRVLAMGDVEVGRTRFRQVIEEDSFVPLTFNFDEIGVVSITDTPGTPWGDETTIVSEATVRLEGQGEFVSQVVTGNLVPMSGVEVYPQIEGQPAPAIPGGDDGDGWVP